MINFYCPVCGWMEGTNIGNVNHRHNYVEGVTPVITGNNILSNMHQLQFPLPT